MPAIKDLNILPQGGHGSIPVVAVAKATGSIPGTMGEMHILASLDALGKVILWDIISGMQIINLPTSVWDKSKVNIHDILLDDWGKAPEVKEKKESMLRNFNINHLYPEQIKITSIQIVQEKLYAYGRNALFIYNLSTLDIKSPMPEITRFFAAFVEEKISAIFLGRTIERSSGRWRFDPCSVGVLSKSGKLYLCIYKHESKKENQKDSYYFNIYNINQPAQEPLTFIEEDLKLLISSIKDIACNDEAELKKLITISESPDGQWIANFYTFKELRESLKLIHRVPVSAHYCICPDANLVAYITLDGDMQLLKVLQIDTGEAFVRVLGNDYGEIFGLKIGLNAENKFCGMLTCAKGLFNFSQNENKIDLKLLFDKKFRSKFDHLLSFNSNANEVVLGPAHKPSSLQSKRNFIHLIQFLEAGMVLKNTFNEILPKIKNVAITKAFFKENLGLENIISDHQVDEGTIEKRMPEEVMKGLNIVLDNNMIVSMLLGGSFRAKNKFLHRGSCEEISFNANENLIGFIPHKVEKGQNLRLVDEFRIQLGMKVLSFSKEEDNPSKFEKIKFSPDGKWFAACSLVNGKSKVDIFDASLWLESPRSEGWNRPVSQFSVFVRHEGGEKKEVPFIDVNFHPEKKWIVIGQLPQPRVAFITIYSWEKGNMKSLYSATIWLPRSNDFNVEFSSTGEYLIFRTLGKSRIHKIIKKEEELEFESIFIDKLEEEKILQENSPKPEERQKMLNFLAIGHLVSIYEISLNSPRLLMADSKILLERKDIRQIEIWDLPTLIEQFSLHGSQRSNFEEIEGKFFKINTAQIPYSSFECIEEKSILIFYQVGGESIKIVSWESDKDGALATLFPVDSKGFLILDANNNYLTNARGHRLAAFMLKGKIFPMEQFDLMLNRPDLVSSSLEKLSTEKWILAYKKIIDKRIANVLEDRLKQAFDLPKEAAGALLENMASSFRKRILDRGESTDRREQFIHLPQIEVDPFENHQKKNTVCLNARVKSLGLEDRPTRLNVYLNDVPLYGKEGIPLHWGKLAFFMDDTKMTLRKNNNKLGVKLRRIKSDVALGEDAFEFIFDIHLKLSKGKNKIQIAVLNIDGIEYFQTLYTHLFLDKEKKTTAPNLYFIGIAVGEHEEKTDLNRMESGMDNLIKALEKNRKDEQARKPDFHLGRLKTFTLPFIDKNGIKVNPTRDNILKFLEETKVILKEKAKVDDKVIFYYGGHGKRKPSNNWELELSCRDMDVRNEDNRKTPGIPYEEFDQFMDGINPLRKLMIIDACSSGEIDAFSVGQVDRFKQDAAVKIDNITQLFSMMKNTFSDLRRGTGTTVIAASLSDQEAIEGIFLDKLIEAIHKKTTVFSILDYLVKDMPGKLVNEILNKYFPSLALQKLKRELQEEIVEVIKTEFSERELTQKLTTITESSVQEEINGKRHNEGDIQQLRMFLQGSIHDFIEEIVFDVPQPTLNAENRTVDWKFWTSV